MKESAKCRSGRDAERVVGTLPGGRGGKSPHPLSDDKGVAADDDGNVVVPSRKGAAFEVVEPELAFEVFVHALRSPSFLDDANDLLVAHAMQQGGEVELGGCVFLRRPLDHQPHRLSLVDRYAVIVRGLDPTERKPSAQGLLRAFSP